MTRQYPHGNANDRYKKRLFVDTGLDFMEVRARIIEPYGSPVPEPKTKEIKIVNAPSHIHQFGLAAYKLTMVLLFSDKISYADYMSFLGWSHVYYDERGQIYDGAVESIKATPAEATTLYKVEVSYVLIKKDRYDPYATEEHFFQDVSPTASGFQDVKDMARLGVTTTINRWGDPVIHFRPSDQLNRAEFASFIVRTKRLLEQAIRE